MSGLSYMKTDFVGLDCEMVGVGPNGDQSSLARCCLVDYDGNVTYERFVKPKGYVTDFRTRYSGIHKWDLRNAVPFEQCQAEVAQLIGAKILVGHALKNDLDALMLSHPRALTRDTAMYRPYMKTPLEDGGKFRMRGLKELAAQFLGINIQINEHDPGEDARTAMMLYRLKQNDWEKFVARMLARSQDPDVRLQAQQQLLQLSANPNVAVHEIPKSLDYLSAGQATHSINGFSYALRSSNGSPTPPLTFVPTVYVEPPKTRSPPASPALQSIGMSSNSPLNIFHKNMNSNNTNNTITTIPEYQPRRVIYQPAAAGINTNNMNTLSFPSAVAGPASSMALSRGAAPVPLPRPTVHSVSNTASSAMNSFYNVSPPIPSQHSQNVHDLYNIRARSVSPDMSMPLPPQAPYNTSSLNHHTVPARHMAATVTNVNHNYSTSNLSRGYPVSVGSIRDDGRDDDLDFSLLEAEWENNCKFLQQVSDDFNSQSTIKNGLQYSAIFGGVP